MGLWDHIKPTVRPPAPASIDQLAGGLRIVWEDRLITEIPFRELRLQCPCAGCVEEWSGKRTIDPATIPDGIHPVKLEGVGNYAVSILWSDGHSTGIYSWTTLRSLGQPAT